MSESDSVEVPPEKINDAGNHSDMDESVEMEQQEPDGQGKDVGVGGSNGEGSGETRGEQEKTKTVGDDLGGANREGSSEVGGEEVKGEEARSSGSSNGRGRGEYDRPKPNFDFGPTGHNYVRLQNDQSELTEEKIDSINALLAERLQAKLSRDFHTADGIQARLEEEHGVIVNNDNKEWHVKKSCMAPLDNLHPDLETFFERPAVKGTWFADGYTATRQSVLPRGARPGEIYNPH
ncbi:hypothetical protein TrRE_jg13127, partial [Triparma retinervis]